MDNDHPHYRVLVIDSGIGGMSIVKAIRNLQLEISITYIADNKFFPYGRMDSENLLNRLHHLVNRALEQSPYDAVVIACNTASTVVMTSLREAFSHPFAGVVPAIKTASEISKSKVIGLLATEATVKSHYINNLIKEFAADCEVIKVGSPHLATIAENKVRGLCINRDHIKSDLEEFTNTAVDTIALGCTHYPFLKDELTEEFSSTVAWLDPAIPVAQQLSVMLQSVDCSTLKPNQNTVYFTDNKSAQDDVLPFVSSLGFSRIDYWS